MASLISFTRFSRVIGCGGGGANARPRGTRSATGARRRGRGPARREPYVVLRAAAVRFRPPTKAEVEGLSGPQAPRAEAVLTPAQTVEQAATRDAPNRRVEVRKTSWPP